MPAIDFVVTTDISTTPRARQLSALFDVPPSEKCSIEYKADLPIEEKEWNIGAIIGPSGSGKSTVLNRVFGEPVSLDWIGKSVLDDFPEEMSVHDIAAVCQSVGFNTIPAWLRPYAVLSNGEKFRVDMARRLMTQQFITIDEFTSVVDRQVAKIGSHAFQKYIRRANKKAVIASCHYDIEDWLQPDWIFEPATMEFRWRSLRQRPSINCEIRRAPRNLWQRFAKFHYMSATVHHSARFYCLYVDDVPAAIAAVIYRPHPRVDNVYGVSRLVCLPDYQGLGLGLVLVDKLAAMYKEIGRRMRVYPAHPALIRSYEKSNLWRLDKRPGISQTNATSKTSTLGKHGGRPNATYEYKGPPFGDPEFSRRFIDAR